MLDSPSFLPAPPEDYGTRANVQNKIAKEQRRRDGKGGARGGIEP